MKIPNRTIPALILSFLAATSAFAWPRPEPLKMTPPADCRVAFTIREASNERGMHGMRRDDAQLKSRASKIIPRLLKAKGYVVDPTASHTFEFSVDRASFLDPSSGFFISPRGSADVSYYDCGLDRFPTYEEVHYFVASNHGDIGPASGLSATGALKKLIRQTIPECR